MRCQGNFDLNWTDSSPNPRRQKKLRINYNLYVTKFQPEINSNLLQARCKMSETHLV